MPLFTRDREGHTRPLALHWQILIGLVLGVVAGGLTHTLGSDVVAVVRAYVQPVGTIFIRLITMVAAPLVLASLITGAASITEPASLGRIGIKTFVLYLTTTALAVTIGLVIANVLQPGASVPAETSARLLSEFSGEAAGKLTGAQDVSVIDQIVNLVPTNPFEALAGGDMLQIVVFALIIGVGLSLISREKAEPVVRFFDAFTDVLIKVVDLIMKLAPYGVFALVAAVTAQFGFGILSTLGWYAFAVLLGLSIQLFGVYAILIKLFARGKVAVGRFYKAMASVQLLAFSTSSSAATLPFNMETARDRLGVSERIVSFVLPLGATVNMDGTALYQGVAAVFIAQVYGLSLTFADQAMVVLTATLASIGTAAVPGAGLIMLIIVLQTAGIPVEGIALILGIDRILDMCRTIVNVTGDAAVAVSVAASEGEIMDVDAIRDAEETALQARSAITL
ncbi:MAG TPA: dicarboxylate/amino acid:cation symporter [Rhodothermales bacterium]|nr:dicarboxylate/amino acid:cation symporter [Rhodothermales bacterium]